MINLKETKTQVTLGIVVVVLGLVGYRLVSARPTYGPASVGITTAAPSAPDADLGDERAVPQRGPGASGSGRGGRLQGDPDGRTVEDDPEASKDQEKKIRKGQRGGRRRNRDSADDRDAQPEKKQQRPTDTRKRGAPFRKAPKGL